MKKLLLLLLAIPVIAFAQSIEWERVCDSGLVATEAVGSAVNVICYAEETPAPPAGANQLTNPWFDGEQNSIVIPGWVNDGHWDVSHKQMPSAARANVKESSHGKAVIGEYNILYQVVPSNGNNLTAKLVCLGKRPEEMNVRVYGSDSENGPWTHLWLAFDKSICPHLEWSEQITSSVSMSGNWDFYKFEISAFFEAWDGAVKVTNSFFASNDA